ncbi:hypothetical protein V1504DRAFT_447190 [Lipomyces starkeyi]
MMCHLPQSKIVLERVPWSHLQLPNVSPDLTSLFNTVQQTGRFQDAMSLANFLNPTEESREEGTAPETSDEELYSQP